MDCDSNNGCKVELVCISIVSHGHAKMLRELLVDLSKIKGGKFEVIITVNVPEDLSPYQGFGFPIKVIENKFPQGFGSNHNKAFLITGARYFAVVNPDIRLRCFDLCDLISAFASSGVAAVAPLVVAPSGTIEDSARHFPTVFSLFKRVFFGRRSLDYSLVNRYTSVDWVAGMFVIFKSEDFRGIGGFDVRRFFMYFEDVDICRRLVLAGLKIVVDSKWSVIHDAQRASHRSFRHLRWHATSMVRFFTGF
jgi:N-acetylglucosaminyl-diphospho-decaprenol L-rhamnosyltransferase